MNAPALLAQLAPRAGAAPQRTSRLKTAERTGRHRPSRRQARFTDTPATFVRRDRLIILFDNQSTSRSIRCSTRKAGRCPTSASKWADRSDRRAVRRVVSDHDRPAAGGGNAGRAYIPAGATGDPCRSVDVERRSTC
jgi:hypothetical protein